MSLFESYSGKCRGLGDSIISLEIMLSLQDANLQRRLSFVSSLPLLPGNVSRDSQGVTVACCLALLFRLLYNFSESIRQVRQFYLTGFAQDLIGPPHAQSPQWRSWTTVPPNQLGQNWELVLNAVPSSARSCFHRLSLNPAR